MRKVYVAMLSGSGRSDVETQMALVEAAQDCIRNGIDLQIRMGVGDSILPRARNRVLMEFLASECDDLILLDDDVVWERGAIRRLLSHDCELVGGVYPTRHEPIRYPVKRIPGGDFDPVTGLLEVRMLPTGFLRVTRSAVNRMIVANPELKYRDIYAPDKTAYALFWFDLRPGIDADDDATPEIWGEDFVFCDRWRRVGGKVWLDTLLAFRHIGRKAYEGCYAETLPICSLLKETA